jgi:hypothetical protein
MINCFSSCLKATQCIQHLAWMAFSLCFHDAVLLYSDLCGWWWHSVLIQIVSLWGQCHFLFLLGEFLFFRFQQFDPIVLGGCFLIWNFLCFLLCDKQEIGSHYFIKYVFSVTLFFLSIQYTDGINIVFLYSCSVPWGSGQIFSSLTSLLLMLYNSSHLFFKFPGSFLCYWVHVLMCLVWLGFYASNCILWVYNL